MLLQAQPVPAQRKQVSVLFVDLCESTARVAAVDPEESKVLLERALRVMSDAVEAYGGTVSQLLGDGLLALFGAPLAQEDHALRSCLAAIRIQQRARDMCDGGGREEPMRVRIGINSGELLVISAKDSLSSHCRVHGTAIHLASRLEHLARAGTVLISGTTFRLVEGQVEATALGSHQIRGIADSVEVYELALAAQPAAAQPPLGRHRSGPLLGREQALAALHAIAEQVGARGMSIVGLRGEPGIGKSRLVIELGDRLRGQGFGVCSVAARAYASRESCGVVAELMLRLMGVPCERRPELQRAQARDMLAGWPAAGRKHLAAVVDLLELGVRGETWLSLSLARRLSRIRDALCWLISERVTGGPLLLVIEDVCLADRDSRRVLESLARRLEGLPVFIVASYRCDFVHPWAGAAWFVEQAVGPLAPLEMNRLARHLLGQDASLEVLVPELVAKADGNPFFLEQLATAMVDDATLAGTPGAYRCTRMNAELRVPASIATVVGAQVDHLPRAAKASLEVAAVIGEPITARLIAAIQNLDTEDAEAHLKLVVSAGLLCAPGRGEAVPHAFRHAVVQELIVRSLTRPRREWLQRAAQLAHMAPSRAAAYAPRATSDEAQRQIPWLPSRRDEAGIANGALQCILHVLEAIGSGQRAEPLPRIHLDPT